MCYFKYKFCFSIVRCVDKVLIVFKNVFKGIFQKNLLDLNRFGIRFWLEVFWDVMEFVLMVFSD